MKLFGSFKLTDRIRIGASTGERKKKSSSKGTTGCGLIILALLVICVPISLIKSCVGGDEKETTTEATTVADETTEQKGIFFDDTSNVELKAGESVEGMFENKSGEKFGKLIFISSDETVATIELDYGVMTSVNYKIKGIAPGTAIVHVESSDGSFVSEKIVVTVLEADTTTEVETTKKETEKQNQDTVAPVVQKTTEPTTKKTTTTAKQDDEKIEYVLNTNTMKIHKSHCDSVKDIQPHNYGTTKDFDKAIAQGYVPCKRCNPSGN